ncbi:hypothetical protein WICPIJ_006267 [Wickerhamomyces pijperi]|uniref:EF-hand domain-containing protein n=1 Tax=Wickerhamomyces pijperi TaxID=599730 RepID=A0A9P8Q2I1_WICPI|nr:hypothetical protein WICPIJ_006267 [Wickerhamomyces pijperi]
MTTPSSSADKPDRNGSSNSAEQLFNKIDINNQGKIDLPTLTKAFHTTKHPLCDNQEAIGLLFKTLDSKNDNSIDYEEFKEYIARAEAQIKEGFTKLDSDKDGRIPVQDLKKYLHTDDDQVVRDFVKFMNDNSTDKRQSNYITYDQWRNFLLFVPRLNGSRLRTAYEYFYNNNDVDLNSEGDITVVNEFWNGIGFFLAGGLSGVVSRTCTAPFDRIKVFLIARSDLSSTILNNKSSLAQNHMGGKVPVEKIKSPIVKAATAIYKSGGLRAFYTGNGLNVVKVFPESAMKFGSFEAVKKLLAKIEGVDDTSKLSKVSTYIAGGLGGVFSQFTVYPIDTLKYRVQCAPLDYKKKHGGSSLLVETAKQIYKEGGLKLFYRGVIVGVTGIFPYAALDLGTFTLMKKWFINREAKLRNCKPEDVQLSNLIVLPMGAFSGTVGSTIVYPINLLRTRLQAQGTYAHPYKYDGFRDVLRQTIQREGYQGLFKGLVPNLAKVCPAVSISYLMYENLKRAMNLE